MQLQLLKIWSRQAQGPLGALGKPLGKVKKGCFARDITQKRASSGRKRQFRPRLSQKKHLPRHGAGRFARDRHQKHTCRVTKKAVLRETVVKNTPAEGRKRPFRPRLSRKSTCGDTKKVASPETITKKHAPKHERDRVARDCPFARSGKSGAAQSLGGEGRGVGREKEGRRGEGIKRAKSQEPGCDLWLADYVLRGIALFRLLYPKQTARLHVETRVPISLSPSAPPPFSPRADSDHSPQTIVRNVS